MNIFMKKYVKLIKKFSERFINNIIEEIIDDDDLIKNT